MSQVLYHESEKGSLLFSEWGGMGGVGGQQQRQLQSKVDLEKKNNSPKWRLACTLPPLRSPPTATVPLKSGLSALLCKSENWDLGGSYRVPAATHLEWRHDFYLLFIPPLEEANRPPLGVPSWWRNSGCGVFAGYFPRVQFRITTSVNHRDFLFFLPWKMNGTYHVSQNILKGFILSFFLHTQS